MNHSLRNLVFIAGLVAGCILRAADVEPPVPVRTVAPDYPPEMRANGTSGLVVLTCEIDEKGAVTDAKVVKTTNEAFNEAAIAAVTKWKFRPAQRDGKPFATHVSLPVKFTSDS